MVFKSTNQLHEIDTHGTVSDVIKRLPAYCRDEWAKRAVVFRREYSKYPDYREFMAYVVEASEDAKDPVYGDSVFVVMVLFIIVTRVMTPHSTHLLDLYAQSVMPIIPLLPAISSRA